MPFLGLSQQKGIHIGLARFRQSSITLSKQPSGILDACISLVIKYQSLTYNSEATIEANRMKFTFSLIFIIGIFISFICRMLPLCRYWSLSTALWMSASLRRDPYPPILRLYPIFYFCPSCYQEESYRRTSSPSLGISCPHVIGTKLKWSLQVQIGALLTPKTHSCSTRIPTRIGGTSQLLRCIWAQTTRRSCT